MPFYRTHFLSDPQNTLRAANQHRTMLHYIRCGCHGGSRGDPWSVLGEGGEGAVHGLGAWNTWKPRGGAVYSLYHLFIIRIVGMQLLTCTLKCLPGLLAMFMMTAVGDEK